MLNVLRTNCLSFCKFLTWSPSHHTIFLCFFSCHIFAYLFAVDSCHLLSVPPVLFLIPYYRLAFILATGSFRVYYRYHWKAFFFFQLTPRFKLRFENVFTQLVRSRNITGHHDLIHPYYCIFGDFKIIYSCSILILFLFLAVLSPFLSPSSLPSALWDYKCFTESHIGVVVFFFSWIEDLPQFAVSR